MKKDTDGILQGLLGDQDRFIDDQDGGENSNNNGHTYTKPVNPNETPGATIEIPAAASAPPPYQAPDETYYTNLAKNIPEEHRQTFINTLKEVENKKREADEARVRQLQEYEQSIISKHKESERRIHEEQEQARTLAEQEKQKIAHEKQEADNRKLKETIQRQTNLDIDIKEFGGNYDEHALWNYYGKQGEAPKIAFNSEVFYEYIAPYEYKHHREISATHIIGGFLAISILALSLYNAHEQAVIQNGFNSGIDASDASSFDHAQSALHYFTSSLGGLIVGAAVLYVVIQAYERSRMEANFAAQPVAEGRTKYGSSTETEEVKDKDGALVQKPIATINAENAANYGKWGTTLTTLGALISSGFLYAALYAKDSGDLGVAAMLSAPVGAVLLILGAQQYSHRAKCEEEGMKNKVYKKDKSGNIEDYFAGAVALLFTGIIFYCTDGLHQSSSSPNSAQSMNDTLEMASRLASALFVLTGIVGGLIMGNKAANAAEKKYNEAPGDAKPQQNCNKVNHNLTIMWALAGLGASLGSLALHLIAGASTSERMGGAGLAAIACVCFVRAGLNSAKSSNNKWIEMKPMGASLGK